VKKSIFKASAVFFGVVLIGYVVDFAVYSALVLAGKGLVVSNAFAFCAGAAINAVLIRKWVFDNHRFEARSDFVLTFLTNVLVFAMGTWLLTWLVNAWRIDVYLAKGLSNAMTFGCNFAIRASIFRKR
jgi:putative flippase GtrA